MGELVLLENELINIYESDNKEHIVSGRELYEFLGIKTQYTKWFDRMCEYGFVENTDFIAVVQSKTTLQGESRFINHYLNIEMTKSLTSLNSKSPKSDLLYSYLSTISGKDVFIQKQPRKEYLFKDMLDKITGLKWFSQYAVDSGKYFLDFYLPSVLIIEYDEKYHNHQQDKDLVRINYCREWLNEHGEHENFDDTWRLPVIRVKEDEELDGLHRIIKHLAGFEVIDSYNYKMEVCDIDNKKLVI